MSETLALYQPAQLTPIPNTTDVNIILSHNLCLSSREISDIQKALNSGLGGMAAEYIWNRTIATLKSYIMQFGSDFVAEMLDRSDFITSENISNHEVIQLSHNLGLINKAAYIELNQLDELFIYYWSDDSDGEKSEFPATRVLDAIRACVTYVLQFGKSSLVSFSSYRDRFKSERFANDDVLISELSLSTYFYKKTTVKTLLNLARTVDQGAEQENVLANLVTVISAIWDGLQSEDKYTIGRAYTQANADGKKTLIRALKLLLMQVKGFDFVPENLRSNSYIDIAKKLLTVHYSMNNFYNEPIVAKELMQMGSSIPSPALGACLTSVIACKLGNGYGISWAAQPYLDNILDGITQDRWSYYLNQVFPNNADILSKISCLDNRYDRWEELVVKYQLDKVTFTNANSAYLLDPANRTKSGRVQKKAQEMYNSLT